MSPISDIAFTVLRHVSISKSEVKCLDILANNETLNAYEIWKLSDYKHYATILRAIKKLKDKNLVNEIVLETSRNATYYSIKFGSKLYYYLITENEIKAIELLKSESKKFNEFYEGFILAINAHYSLIGIYERIISLTIKNEKYDLEKVIEENASDTIVDYLNDVVNDIVYNRTTYDNEVIQTILYLSKKYTWIYNVTMEKIKGSLDWGKKLYDSYTNIRSMIET